MSSICEFRRPLEYKAERRGGLVMVADRWFPSSETSRNLLAYGLSRLNGSTASSAGCEVCGEEVSFPAA
ncbi:MAG: hypothetical protein OWR62_14965 [Sulfobacillus thermotolerans]|nr:hypothetical protein [Sulfobacillus thermotolerans]